MKQIDPHKQVRALLIAIAIISLVSCAPGEVTTKEYGFFYGLWHGIILPIAVIGKMFSMEHGIYAVNNSGTWYWIGYFIGLLIIGVGGSSARRN